MDVHIGRVGLNAVPFPRGLCRSRPRRRRCRLGDSVQPNHSFADFLPVGTARCVNELGPRVRRVGILGRLRIACKDRAAHQSRQKSRGALQPEMAEDIARALADIRKEIVEIDGDDSVGKRLEGIVLPPRFSEPTDGRQFPNRHFV